MPSPCMAPSQAHVQFERPQAHVQFERDPGPPLPPRLHPVRAAYAHQRLCIPCTALTQPPPMLPLRTTTGRRLVARGARGHGAQHIDRPLARGRHRHHSSQLTAKSHGPRRHTRTCQQGFAVAGKHNLLGEKGRGQAHRAQVSLGSVRRVGPKPRNPRNDGIFLDNVVSPHISPHGTTHTGAFSIL